VKIFKKNYFICGEGLILPKAAILPDAAILMDDERYSGVLQPGGLHFMPVYVFLMKNRITELCYFFNCIV